MQANSEEYHQQVQHRFYALMARVERACDTELAEIHEEARRLTDEAVQMIEKSREGETT